MCLCLSDHVPPLRAADRVAGGEATEQRLGALLVSSGRYRPMWQRAAPLDPVLRISATTRGT